MRGNDMSISAAADTDDLQQTLEDQILHIDGLRSWMMALLGHLVIFTTWGFVNAFGIFQTYYVRDLKLASDSQVAWIGSTQLFLLFAIGILSGRALDRGYFRITFIIGSAIQLIGIFMLSLCTVYWQVFLTQAVCVGFGNGIVFVPSVALISTYFKRYRALALGLATIGFATGADLYKPQAIRRQNGPLLELSALRSWRYASALGGAFFLFWAVYLGFYFIGSFGRNIIGVSQATSINLLLTMNGLGVIGRIISTTIAARIGSLNVMIPMTLCTALLGSPDPVWDEHVVVGPVLLYFPHL
ncbi:putative mfs monocarboxylate transporter protein [Eutypa lata UCREL1]|uniref:Putative mfs monocarboxylate transporter protein n=1 Tax=Eutypa lata (strain UCR-EL1) TaxID=1287681 RepID=M7SKX0_EUTLA|nr:putative mfs monocarboxylate transporter protein [Eutypa lata UCREL1]